MLSGNFSNVFFFFFKLRTICAFSTQGKKCLNLWGEGKGEGKGDARGGAGEGDGEGELLSS